MALLASVGNLGGIVGSNIFLAKEEPKYPAGFGVGLAISVASVIMAFVLRFAFAAENRKRDALLAERGSDAIRVQYSEQELLDMGDLSPFFRYTL
jgi:hypothetical protein